MSDPATRWVLAFDASCEQCRKASEAVEHACGGKVELLSLMHQDVRRWRAESFGEPAPWKPTLLQVEQDRVRGWAGPGMAVALVRRLGLRATVRTVGALNDLRRARRGRAVGRGPPRQPPAGLRRADRPSPALPPGHLGRTAAPGPQPALGGTTRALPPGPPRPFPVTERRTRKGAPDRRAGEQFRFRPGGRPGACRAGPPGVRRPAFRARGGEPAVRDTRPRRDLREARCKGSELQLQRRIQLLFQQCLPRQPVHERPVQLPRVPAVLRISLALSL